MASTRARISYQQKSGLAHDELCWVELGIWFSRFLLGAVLASTYQQLELKET